MTTKRTLEPVDLSELSGYNSSRSVVAQRYNIDGKSVFAIALPLHLISSHLPIPDPEQPFEGNRRVIMSHARKFGEFWRANPKCITPALLFDTTWPLSSDFEPKFSAAGVEFGVLNLPHNSAEALEILDGQHRILGWHLIGQAITREVKEASDSLAKARSLGESDSEEIWTERLEAARQSLKRFESEFVSLMIVEGLTGEEHRQIFADIANNAKGISKSVTVQFDTREILNRVAIELVDEHRLLAGLVDGEKDNVRGASPYLLSTRNVADLIKATLVGIPGRMTERREKSWSEPALEEVMTKFLDLLISSFPDLSAVVEDELSPAELREKSLLGSITILRCLAAAFHTLAVEEIGTNSPVINRTGFNRAEKLFKSLSGHMDFPIADGWMDTTYFPEPESRAPGSRAQELKGLTETLVRWANEGIFS